MAPVSMTVRAASRVSVRRALSEVLGSPGRIAGFVVAAGVVAFFYTLLLPFDYTQRFEFANWDYLNAYLLAWAIVFGLAMGLVGSVQVYAMCKVAAARAASGAAGGVALAASLLPSFLCCTPIIPSLLAFVGVSGVGLYTTTGTLQHFFAVHQTEFLSASLVLLACMCWWGLRKVACSQCFTEDGCAIPAGSNPLPDDCCSDAEVTVAPGAEVRSNQCSGDAPRAREGALR